MECGLYTFIVLYRHVFKWSPLCRSIRMMRLCATPSSSSFLWPSNLMTNNVTPYSGKLCQPWMNFNFDSISDRSLTLACASSMRFVAWNSNRIVRNRKLHYTLLLEIVSYLSFQFLANAWRKEIVWLNRIGIYADSGCMCRFLHAQKWFYARHFWVVRTVGQWTSLRC